MGRVIPFPGKHGGAGRSASTGFLSGQMSQRPGQMSAADVPDAVAREFQDRWSAWLRATHANPSQVAAAFGVDRRAAERWWSGEGSCNARYLAAALAADPGALEALVPEVRAAR